MNQLSPDVREDLLEVLDEVSTLMSAADAQLSPCLMIIHWHSLVLRMGQRSFWTTSRTARQVSHLIICSIYDQRAFSRYLCQICRETGSGCQSV